MKHGEHPFKIFRNQRTIEADGIMVAKKICCFSHNYHIMSQKEHRNFLKVHYLCTQKAK